MHIKGWETLCCTTLPEKPADHKTANFIAFLYEDILELRGGADIFLPQMSIQYLLCLCHCSPPG